MTRPDSADVIVKRKIDSFVSTAIEGTVVAAISTFAAVSGASARGIESRPGTSSDATPCSLPFFDTATAKTSAVATVIATAHGQNHRAVAPAAAPAVVTC